ncbi:MAG: 1-(5-phosphoribosyl)-5-[(5-phosphoribosylamino)methylideneamino]imidazole-4-carboxamide isomerase [Eubacteriales bacterium]|nr:1-(5-phosphoribosyl)-5-[(5-phosphoribosylamino)methylideneamino]imidazole-4-carboxamide isomerase [Eubacteriales bacterium]
MIVFPAIDLYENKAVRLLRGDYAAMTVYDNDPTEVARAFVRKGAAHVHLVDLEGARDGSTPNLETVRRIAQTTPLFTEIGGGIRTMETAEKYFECGVDRVVLGTAAVTDPAFLAKAVVRYGDKIAVGVDIRDGRAAIRGWREQADVTAAELLTRLQDAGVSTVICTDISRDGAMKGVNLALYRELSAAFRMRFVASGGVSTIEDVRRLRELDLYGVIVGKAYYTGAIDLARAIEEAAQ